MSKAAAAAAAAAGPLSGDQAQTAAAKLMQNPEFMALFQKAVEEVAASSGGGAGAGAGAMPPPADDPTAHAAWLRKVHERMHAAAEEEARKKLETPQTDADGTTWMYVQPEPGFCIKCVTVGTAKREKVFINLCKHSRIAEPMPMTDDEVAGHNGDGDLKDAHKYRIPLSCSAARDDTDKSGEACRVYDVIVNPATIMRCGEDREFRRFVCAMAMFWIKQKYEKHMNADEFTNLNFKAKGKLQIQRIHARTADTPNGSKLGAAEGIQIPTSASVGTTPTLQSGRKATRLVMEVDPAAVAEEDENKQRRKQLEEEAEKEAKQREAAEEADKKRNKPTFTSSKVGTYDWSAHGKPTKNPYFHETVPAEFAVEVFLGERVTSVKEVDVRIGAKNKSVELRWIDDVADDEDCEPFLVVPLDCPVADEPSAARFSKKTKTLSLRLPVVLPDEVAMEQRSAAQTRAEREAEEAAEQARRSADEQAAAARRAKYDRMQAEEADVMRQRKELVENMRAVQEGAVPPMLKSEIDAMPKDQAHSMLIRLETRTRNGDGLDQLLDTLPEEALFATCNCLRDRLGLETKQPPAPKKKQPADDGEEDGTGAGAAAIKNTEYNSANKAENLFGVKMYNRYLFALDN